MLLFQNVMTKNNLYNEDQFGVINYNYSVISAVVVLLYAAINLMLGYITYVAELGVVDANITTYKDAVWLMVMGSTSIGFGDFYPVTLVGRTCVFTAFVLGVGMLGTIGALFANKVMGFADTNIKNRELRKQNEDIYEQNATIYKKLEEVEVMLKEMRELNDQTKP